MNQSKYSKVLLSILLIVILVFANNLISIGAPPEGHNTGKGKLVAEQAKAAEELKEMQDEKVVVEPSEEESQVKQEIVEEEVDTEPKEEENEVIEVEELEVPMISMMTTGDSFSILSLVNPVYVPGNDPEFDDECETLKIDPPMTGTFGPITITSIYDEGRQFDFTSTVPISHVFVKGGPGGNLYSYDPAVLGDTGLHPPVNENNDKYYGISHITFYFCETVEPLGRIAGIKFNDVNADGLFDPMEEIGLDGFRIEIHNGYPMTEDTLMAYVITSGGGYFEFGDLPLGTYYIKEIQQEGFKQTTPVDPDYFVVEITEENLDVEDLVFGNVEYSSLSGFKFNDLNGMNGWEDGEPGIEGWEITLYKLVGEEYVLYVYEEGMGANPVYTDAMGSYVFENLLPGTYKIIEENRAGWVQTYPAGDGFYDDIELLGGENQEDFNFGNKVIQYQFETAWAQGTPFTPGKNGSWAMYFTYSGSGEVQKDLLAGQHHEAGHVKVNRMGNTLYVTYHTTGDWMLTEVHLSVENTLGEIPQNKSKNPQIGHFEYKAMFDPEVNEHTFEVDVTGMSDPIYIAAHAVVKRPMP